MMLSHSLSLSLSLSLSVARKRARSLSLTHTHMAYVVAGSAGSESRYPGDLQEGGIQWSSLYK